MEEDIYNDGTEDQDEGDLTNAEPGVYGMVGESHAPKFKWIRGKNKKTVNMSNPLYEMTIDVTVKEQPEKDHNEEVVGAGSSHPIIPIVKISDANEECSEEFEQETKYNPLYVNTNDVYNSEYNDDNESDIYDEGTSLVL